MFRALAENASDMLSRHAPDGTYLYVNPACTRVLGYDPDEMVGRSAYDFMPVDDATRRQSVDTVLTSTGGSVTSRYRMLRRDGTPVWVESVLSGAPLAGGGYELHAVTRDLTHRLGEEIRRRTGDRVLADVTGQASDALIHILEDGTLAFVSAASRGLLGFLPEELIGRPFTDVVHPDDLDRSRAIWQDAMRSDSTSFSVELRLRRRDGEHLWAEVNGRLVERPGGRFELFGSARDISQRRADEELRRQWELSFEHTRRGIAITDPATGIMTAVNPSFARMHGGEVSDFAGRPLASVFTAESAKRIPEPGEPVGQSGYVQYEGEHVRRDGTTFPVRTEVIAARDERGGMLYRISYHEDLSTQHAVEDARREATERFLVAFRDAPVGIALVAPGGKWLKVNDALCSLLEYSEEELLGMSSADVTHPDDLESDRELVRQLLDGERDTFQTERRYLTRRGHQLWVQLSASLVRDEAGGPRYFIEQVQDISQRKLMERQLVFMAEHDPLTDLMNRRRFEAELAGQVERCRRYGERASLLLVDLDNFKYVNDTYGHSLGDRVIRHVANVLQARLRRTDTLARLGGDEFAVLLPHVAGDRGSLVASELVEALSAAPLDLDGTSLHVTASIGVATLDDAPGDGETALIRADLAMYQAKEAGRNRSAAHTPDMDVRVTGGMAWSQRLREALGDERFVVHAQPVVDMRSGEPQLYELLVRMVQPDGKLVMPDHFLPAADRFGHLPGIDRFVVREAIALLATRPDDFTVSVNLAAKSVVDLTICDYVGRLLAEAGVDGRRLVVELTEQDAVSNLRAARDVTERLRRLGCRIALDDFGSGFGGFSYLKHLPLDILKIDGSFVQEIAVSRTDQLVVSAVVDVVTGLGKEVIAERVADERTRDALIEHGVVLGQGFLFAEPALAV